MESLITVNSLKRHFKQFLLLSQCFKKSSASEASESVRMWKSVKQPATISHHLIVPWVHYRLQHADVIWSFDASAVVNY